MTTQEELEKLIAQWRATAAENPDSAIAYFKGWFEALKVCASQVETILQTNQELK